MSLNAMPSAERVHIGFFGLRNAGKSSLVNAVTGQNLSVVSEIRGTTTDPVKKSMELLPLGPVVIIDTPGIDDEGALGDLRVRRTRQVLRSVDIAVLVADAAKPLTDAENELIALFQSRGIARNKADLLPVLPEADKHEIYVSALEGTNLHEFMERLARLVKTQENSRRIVADLLTPGDLVVLVVPIDTAAPKGRLILPQQQTIRDILEAGAMSVVCRETELPATLAALGRQPRMVITDSQAFERVSRDTPEDIALTSFSILFARYKYDLAGAVRGAARRSSTTCVMATMCLSVKAAHITGSVRISVR